MFLGWPSTKNVGLKIENVFKWLLLRGRTDFEIISKKCCLADPLPKLQKPFCSAEQDGRPLSTFLLKGRTDFKIISQHCSLGGPLPKLLKGSARQNKMATRAKIRKTYKQLLQNRWTDFEIISQECSSDDPLPKLLKQFHSTEQDGHHS